MSRSLTGLGFASTGVEQGLCIATGLFTALKDEITGRLERHTGLEIRGHVAVARIAAILLIHLCGHALQGVHDLLARADPVV